MSDVSWEMIFDGWAPVIRTLLLGTLGYTALVALLRVSGKRTLSKMNAFDLVVTVAFGSTLASMLTSRTVSLAQGIVALALLILLQAINTSLSVLKANAQSRDSLADLGVEVGNEMGRKRDVGDTPT